MAHFSSTKLAPWRSDLSYPRGWRDARPRLIDYLIDLTGVHTVDGLGLAHIALPDAKFLTTFGVAKTIVPDPGDVAPAHRVELAQWVANKAPTGRFMMQKLGWAEARATILGFIPAELLEPLKVNGSLISRSIEFIFTTFDAQLGVFTEADLIAVKAELTSMYEPMSSIRVCLAQTCERPLRILREEGQSMSNADAVRAIKGKFSPITFQLCWEQYAVTNGPLVTQTPATLMAAIIVFVEERMNAGTPLGGVALQVAVAADNQALARTVAELTAAVAALTKAKSTVPSKHYCHTHGPCGHNSTKGKGPLDCHHPGPHHDATATVNDHKGGREKR